MVDDFMIKKLILICTILIFLTGMAYATDLKDTSDVKVNGNDLQIDGKTVANVTEYKDTSYIDKILTENPIIKAVGGNGANEVDSVSDYNLVYEYLTDDGFYYSFGHDGKYYVVTINEDNWHADMLTKMDNWCVSNRG